jgi:hypothetical protein
LTSVLVLLLAAVTLAGCATDDASDHDPFGEGSAGDRGGRGGGGRGGGGGGGTGGGPAAGLGDAGEKDPAAVRSGSDCFYEGNRGSGGADAIWCQQFSVVVEPGIAAEEQVSLSSDVLAEAPVPACGSSFGANTCVGTTPGNPASSFISVRHTAFKGPGGVYPTTFTVRISRAGTTVAQKTFSDLRFQCVARTWDDWCWEAAPVTFARAP